MSEPTIAELKRQLDELQSRLKDQGGAPLDKNLNPLSKPINAKGMHKDLVKVLNHTQFATGGEKDGVKVVVPIKVSDNDAPEKQTAILVKGTWVLDKGSKTVSELVGAAVKEEEET